MRHRKAKITAEFADVSRDGKQVRIVKTTRSRFAPEQDEEIALIDWDQAEELRDSLDEVLE